MLEVSTDVREDTTYAPKTSTKTRARRDSGRTTRMKDFRRTPVEPGLTPDQAGGSTRDLAPKRIEPVASKSNRTAIVVALTAVGFVALLALARHLVSSTVKTESQTLAPKIGLSA